MNPEAVNQHPPKFDEWDEASRVEYLKLSRSRGDLIRGLLMLAGVEGAEEMDGLKRLKMEHYAAIYAAVYPYLGDHGRRQLRHGKPIPDVQDKEADTASD